jgi:carbon storage regulator
MLVLSRRANQSIVIGSDVVVTVLEIRGDHVRLGIQAPRTVTVHREEVYAEIQRENRSAAAVSGEVLSTLPQPPS